MVSWVPNPDSNVSDAEYGLPLAAGGMNKFGLEIHFLGWQVLKWSHLTQDRVKMDVHVLSLGISPED